jgi:hypothetical protein
MPRRTKDKYGDHHGKHKYISENYQRNWEVKDSGKLEVKTEVEMDMGEKVEIKTEVELNPTEYPKEVKNKRRELIKKHHPDNQDDQDDKEALDKSSEKLKKILDEYGS